MRGWPRGRAAASAGADTPGARRGVPPGWGLLVMGGAALGCAGGEVEVNLWVTASAPGEQAGRGGVSGSGGGAGQASGGSGGAGRGGSSGAGQGGEASGCVPDPPLEATSGACVQKGAKGFLCNPVSQEGCDAARGESCDLAKEGEFRCFPPPNDAAACAPCSNQEGPFCAPGYSCNGGLDRCTRYCCDDADCGGRPCVLQPPTGLGICQATRDDLLSSFGVSEVPAVFCGASLDLAGPVCLEPAGSLECDPVTGQPCEPGHACDVFNDGFSCFAPPNDALLCAPCGGEAGIACAPGLGCFEGTCARYCCEGSSCGEGAVCLRAGLLLPGERVGLCVVAPPP